MRALRLSDFAQAVFLFVGFEVFPGCFHLLMVGDAKAVVIVETLFRRVRSPFMYDQAPLCVGVLECGYARLRSTTSMANRSVKTGRVSAKERHS